MQIVESIRQMQDISNSLKRDNTIGFVPTMGDLHNGHISLVKRSIELCDKTIVSIFVNPLQFSQGEDFDKYPRNKERDIDILKQLNVDYVFYPNEEEMYNNPLTIIKVKELSEVLCGAKRKGHFEGVCTIVAKLFNIVKPNKVFFGKKDFQQYLIIKKMIEDLNYDIEIIPCDIVREEDGLAMSSRNRYLNKQEREYASFINKYIKESIELIKDKGIDIAKEYLTNKLSSIPNSRIDYVEILSENNLKKPKDDDRALRIFVAVFIGDTRLIDNMEVRL